jgi:hypothetical protein
MLSGCAGWVVFGHTIGQESSASPVQAAPAAPAAAVAQEPAPPAPASQPRAKAPVAQTKFRTANLVFTPDVKAKIAADPRFSGEALFTAIGAGLRSHDLMQDSGDTQADHTVEIDIDDFVIRPASNAVLFGYVLSTATLTGRVVVRDAAGRELRRYRIKASSRLATPATGEPPQPLDSLYNRFADLTVSKLTGMPIKVAEQDVPR